MADEDKVDSTDGAPPKKRTRHRRARPLWMERFDRLAAKESLETITIPELAELEKLDERRRNLRT